MMAIDGDGDITGSVSGGCVEGAVIEVARETLDTAAPQLLHFGVADETAWGVGLACGGSIDIFVEKLDLDIFESVNTLVSHDRAGAIATIVRGDDALLGQKTIISDDRAIVSDMSPKLQEQVTNAVAGIKRSDLVKLDDDTVVFVDFLRAAPTLVAVGGGEIAIALTDMARISGYHSVVIDPRSVFASESRFPNIDQLIQKWPRSAFAEIDLSPDTAVALLTHDPKIDDPALKVVLNSDVFYIGALGSRKTHAKRLKRLASMGFTNEQVERIHAPIGLDIGAVNPQEIAVAIMAEIIAVSRGSHLSN
jgi:xanthine dehydrogenase accessory factor